MKEGGGGEERAVEARKNIRLDFATPKGTQRRVPETTSNIPQVAEIFCHRELK